jgi:hypothetical protein
MKLLVEEVQVAPLRAFLTISITGFMFFVPCAFAFISIRLNINIYWFNFRYCCLSFSCSGGDSLMFDTSRDLE